MSGTERRLSLRKEMRVPVRFRALGSNAAQILVGETQNTSERGIYFTTNQPLKVGAPLELFLKVPDAKNGNRGAEIRCDARVVRLIPQAGPNGQLGVGAFIERFEPPAAAVHLKA